MKNAFVAMVIVITALAGIAMASWYWFKWGPRPDILVQGQVIDRDSGQGVADAHVILAVRAYTSSYGGTHSGCTEGSAVVRTDKDGKFTYSITAREAFGPENPGGWGVTIYVYHPEFDAAVLPGMQNLTKKFFAANPTLDGEWPQRPPDIHMTFPHYYDKDEGWATVEVIKRESSEWQHIRYFTSKPERMCIEAPVDRGQSGLIDVIHMRAWGLFCSYEDDKAFESHPDEPDGRRAYYLFSSIFSAYLYDVRRTMSEAQRGEITARKSDYVRDSILPLYPRSKSDSDFGRDFTFAEREKFCEFFTPPLERVLGSVEQ